MCGIAGLVGQVTEARLTAMADAIAHRGPDGWGVWCDRDVGIGLAHRRLAIIDLTDAASQPMGAVAGRYQIVFNGEIYNFKALAADLLARGYQFNANSDTGILAPLYDAYGPGMLERLNGIFAFAIWDTRDRCLFIARDHAGTKPLYYAQTPVGLGFASELKALVTLPGLDLSIDLAALRDYLEKLWCPGEGTPFKAVRKLPPGHFMRVSADGAMTILPWTSTVGASPGIPATPRAAEDALAALLDEVVDDQCLSDVPVGAFLSGGVDSTAIVAAMVARGRRPAATYCIGFDGPGMDDEGFGNDLAYARIAADALGVPLTPMMMAAPHADDFARLAAMLDEPQADPSPLYVEAISRQARLDGVTVLLSGAGGDDIFSGYRRHVAARLRERAGPARHLAGLVPDIGAGSALGRKLAKLKGLMGGSDTEFLNSAFSFNPPELVDQCLSTDTRAEAAASGNPWWDKAVSAGTGHSLVERAIRLERFGFLPDHNLNYTDKASMAHGIEVRVPFLDPRLIAFADALPTDWKVHGLEPKWLLKRALERRVPREIVTRTKTGFGGPVRHWVAGPLASLVGDLIGSQSFKQRGLFDSRGVTDVANRTRSGAIDGSYLLLAIVMMELWLARFAPLSKAT
jgi:asparagine synthase (glutamine-hydrolysing)